MSKGSRSSYQASSITAKRARSTPQALRRRRAAGEVIPLEERAFTRLGRTATQVLAGQDDLSTWDDEELRRGRRRDKHGKFQGRDPDVIPKAMHDELVRRMTAQAQALMRDNLVAAVEVLVDIATDPAFEGKDRLKAVEMIMARVMGKPKETIEVTSDKPWQVALLGGIVHSEVDPDDIVEADAEDE